MRRVVFRHNGKFRQSNIYHRTNLANPQQQPQTRNVRVTLAGAEPLRLETTAEIPKLSAEANRVPWPRPRFALEAELQRKFPNFAAVVEAPVMVLLRSRAGLRRRGGRRGSPVCIKPGHGAPKAGQQFSCWLHFEAKPIWRLRVPVLFFGMPWAGCWPLWVSFKRETGRGPTRTGVNKSQGR